MRDILQKLIIICLISKNVSQFSDVMKVSDEEKRGEISMSHKDLDSFTRTC